MQQESQILLFYVTHPNQEHADKLAQQLLDEKLIACANLFPMTSVYTWNGQACRDEEIASVYKTSIKYADKVEQRIAALHEYDVPCILRSIVTANAAYAQWVEEQIQPV